MIWDYSRNTDEEEPVCVLVEPRELNPKSLLRVL